MTRRSKFGAEKREIAHEQGGFYDSGQLNIGGSSLKDFILTACILRKRRMDQAELMDTENKNSVLIVPLEKILTKGEM